MNNFIKVTDKFGRIIRIQVSHIIYYTEATVGRGPQSTIAGTNAYIQVVSGCRLYTVESEKEIDQLIEKVYSSNHSIA